MGCIGFTNRKLSNENCKVDFNPAPGTYENPQYISLNTKTDSAIIHYTLDGSPPNQGSAVYDQPIYINNNTVVKAIAYTK